MRVFPFVHPEYPDRLRSDPTPPECIWVEGELVARPLHVAIIGAREATLAALAYAHDFARAVASAGAVVVSGGARGIDAAAHRGAMNGGGVTWAILPTGHEHPFPSEHAELFAEIPKRGGATLSQFAPESDHVRGSFHARNRVLVGLSDVVVIIQAGLKSGTRNAAKCARLLNRPLWAVPAAPWDKGFEGCHHEIALGAISLTSTEKFLQALRLTSSVTSRAESVSRSNPNENKVLECLGTQPIHVDEIVLMTALSVGQVATALLTMALEDVVVEAPERCYRRKLTT